MVLQAAMRNRPAYWDVYVETEFYNKTPPHVETESKARRAIALAALSNVILILLGAILEFGLPATNCAACTNERNHYMEQNNLVCDEYPLRTRGSASRTPTGRTKQKFCQRSFVL